MDRGEVIHFTPTFDLEPKSLNNYFWAGGLAGIFAAVELIKRTVNVPKNYLPLAALIIGLLVGAVSTPFTDWILY